MMANNDMSRWCVLYTAPKSERKVTILFSALT